ncbi:MAG: hypothetical protein ABSF40_16575 [Candidatus Acidiferrales bacterium]
MAGPRCRAEDPPRRAGRGAALKPLGRRMDADFATELDMNAGFEMDLELELGLELN